MTGTITVSGKKYYNSSSKSRIISLSLGHLLLGILCGITPTIAFYWGIGILLIGIYKIISTQDKYLYAAKIAGYYMGMEAMLRITKGYLSWEFAKYGVIILLGLGLIIYGKKKISPIFLIFIALLIPSLLIVNFPDFEEARTSILFNLSGPFCLAVSGIYFYRRTVSINQLYSIFEFIFYPIIVLLTYLTFFTPDLDTIEFGSVAISETSGGFGPNQVATVLGLGMSILTMTIMLRKPLLKYWWVDLGVLLYLGFRSLITFSRGGTLSVLVVLVIFLLILFVTGKMSKLNRSLISIIVISLGSFLVWSITNSLTKEALSYRYQGVNVRTGEVQDITSGRLLILQSELSLFRENIILGVGPGMGKLYREKLFGVQVSAHSEFSRLLGEHGLFGLAAMLILLILPLKIMIESKNNPKIAITLIWVGLAIYTMVHSAMRLALPGFIYGLGLISLYVSRNNLR